ncbi:MAG: radical SAM protein [Anaerolineales bacterium]|nr:radical SAM protein [Anaerolineales bacterium]
MEPIDLYTSTGVKFWRHPEQMHSFLNKKGKTVISTHISPTGRCNLNCEYCSVSKRGPVEEISLGVIKTYISELLTRGLKAVILTGGGEPTLYNQFAEIVDYIREQGLGLGLITNGTAGKNFSNMDWVRISVNYDTINTLLKSTYVFDLGTTIGLSMVYSGKNKQISYIRLNELMDKLGAEYLRVLPNCLPQELDEAHEQIDRWIQDGTTYKGFAERVIHQHKQHRTPPLASCLQSYFRPYLSEYEGGTVFPCDSVVLNNHLSRFDKKYSICPAHKVGDYLDGRILPKFAPFNDCQGCVFYNNNMMLYRFTHGVHEFHKHQDLIKHENFI